MRLVGGRRFGWLFAGVLGLVAALAAIYMAADLWPSARIDLDRADKLASVASLMVGVISAVLSVIAIRRAGYRPVSAAVEPFSDAVEQLADQVVRQWREEARLRGVSGLDPLRVSWSSTARPVAAAAVEVLGRDRVPDAPAQATRLRLRGDITEVHRVLAGLPSRRLVVIGAPGAGKSTLALLLTLGLLADRRAGQPVPVLLQLASWNPLQQRFDAWLGRRLVELYPMLGPDGPFTGAATRMIDRNMVIPVLDGLDEMPEPARAQAVVQLAEALGGDRPLVLTCRAREYQAAVTRAGAPLNRAAVVELEPVTAAEAAGYLPAGQIDGHRRWAAVLAHLRDDPHGPLAQALSTPLMVYLARISYRAGNHPAQLLGFTDRTAIENHLLAGWLPALYAPDGLQDQRRPRAPGRLTYPADKAIAWLAFLACHLTEQHTPDLAWWRLHRAIPRAVAVTAGLVLGAAVGLLFGLTVWLTLGATPGLIAGTLGAVVYGLVAGFGFREWVPAQARLRTGSGRATAALLVGAAVGVATAVAGTRVFGVAAGLTLAVPFGLAAAGLWLAAPTPPGEATTPQGTLHADRVIVLVNIVLTGLANGLTFGFTYGPATGAGFALAGAVTSALMVGLTGGASGAAAGGIAGVLVYGLAAGPAIGLAAGLAAALTAWIVIASPTYLITQTLLAARRRTPLRLMRFLNDAHHRGILRQNGATYQLRHHKLQQHLTTIFGTERAEEKKEAQHHETAEAQQAEDTRQP